MRLLLLFIVLYAIASEMDYQDYVKEQERVQALSFNFGQRHSVELKLREDLVARND